MRRDKLTWQLAVISALLFSMLLAACQPTQSPTTQMSQVTNTIAESNASQSVTSSPTRFSLTGRWSGVATNGDYKMDAIIEFNDSCQIGEVCGHYNLLSIPCAGSYTLQKEENGKYEFSSGDYIGNCSASEDYFQLGQDGTLGYTSRGDFGETIGTLSPITPIPVIYDDDGSPDGTLALMYFLSDPRVSLKSISISYGEANPKKYIQLVGALLDSFGINNIPLGAGKSAPLGGDNVFPAWMREKADNFWNQPIPPMSKVYPVQDAAQLMVDTLNSSPVPVTIFISGPCTNLAEALRLDPGIKTHIKAVFIMGGALYTQGNLSDLVADPENGLAEWNIYADPQAASEVFQSGLDIYLVPLDATDQVAISHNDTASWRTGGKAAQFAAKMYDEQITAVNRDSFYYWDAMTAEILVNPSLCQFKQLNVEVVTTDGARDGQTRAMTSGDPNINACLQPDAINLIHTIDSIMAASH
jgi:purine nucleosidase/pyrimidine-specific ribonucleoside hydrolase